ncbi:hypothetical protein QUB60_21490 [Microcoleus sp. A2-C5]|uniref:hypothetical protein n=1 Tax=unclassified Microcoleus TaxID=2642155 RepID=UPI002FCE93A7
MNSLILISPYKGSGFKPILSGRRKKEEGRRKNLTNKKGEESRQRDRDAEIIIK